MAVEIFFDCGAPSLYNELSRRVKNKNVMGSHMKHWHLDDFSYVESPDYKKYRRDYLNFLREESENLSAFSNLDVVHNAELTYANQKWFEKRGVKPLPVWHLGTDVKWLRKYLSEGYAYVCMGGLVPNPPAVLRPALDRIWRDELTDKEGMPKVKVHGFGLASFDLMYRYPWYSVDAKTWIDISRFGSIFVPKRIGAHGRDWLHPTVVCVSNRRDYREMVGRHHKTLSEASQKFIEAVLKDIGTSFGKSEFVSVPNDYELGEGEQWLQKPNGQGGKIERVVEPGVMNSHLCRNAVNMHVFKQIERLVPTWPWSIRQTIGLVGGGRLL